MDADGVREGSVSTQFVKAFDAKDPTCSAGDRPTWVSAQNVLTNQLIIH